MMSLPDEEQWIARQLSKRPERKAWIADTLKLWGYRLVDRAEPSSADQGAPSDGPQ